MILCHGFKGGQSIMLILQSVVEKYQLAETRKHKKNKNKIKNSWD